MADLLKVTVLDQRTDRRPKFRDRHPERCRPRVDIAAESIARCFDVPVILGRNIGRGVAIASLSRGRDAGRA